MAGATTQVKILVPGDQSMVALLGQRDVFLKLIESAFDCRILVRGNETISGAEDESERAARIFEELLALLEKGHELTDSSVGQAIALVKGDERSAEGRPALRPSENLGDRLLTARGKGIAPKTAGQKQYIEAILSHDIVFAVGTGGDGQDLTSPWRARCAALKRKEVDRIFLVRPVVEAGESLGFLPGDFLAKLDPYMRPVLDALFDMIGPGGPRSSRRTERSRSPLSRTCGAARSTTPCDPRRGAEHDADADEDVPHASGRPRESA